MYRLFLLSLLLMTAAAGAEVLYRAEDQVVPAEYLGTDGEGILVRFALPALTAETVTVGQFGEGTLMRIPGEGMGMPMGSPDLPVIRRMVLIPNTGDVTIEMVSTEATPLGIFDIPPFQEYPTRSGGAAPYRIDRDIYSTSELYPSQPVILDRISILRDIRVAWVYFSPVQYNPVTGETVLNTEVTVRLAVSGTGENEIPRPFQGHTRSFIPIYEQVLGFEVAGSNVIDGSYLVIGIQDAIDCVQDLIDWKKQTGTEVFYGVIPSIGSTAAEIDDYIEDAYNTWPNPPEWVLLVGDEDVMPVYYSSGTAADNQYGVIGTGYDPSIHVGRICGDTADLTYQAWKIESHESDPYEPSPSWFQHAISIGSTDFQDPWMSYRYSEIFQANGMPTTLYCSNTTYGGIPPTVALISDEINDGTSLVSYIGHGSTQSWGTTGFDNGDVAALSNGRRLSWISSIACYNGEFQGSTTCFGEAWMNEGTEASPKGAIGFMGATTSSPVGPTDSLALYQFRLRLRQDHGLLLHRQLKQQRHAHDLRLPGDGHLLHNRSPGASLRKPSLHHSPRQLVGDRHRRRFPGGRRPGGNSPGHNLPRERIHQRFRRGKPHHPHHPRYRAGDRHSHCPQLLPLRGQRQRIGHRCRRGRGTAALADPCGPRTQPVLGDHHGFLRPARCR